MWDWTATDWNVFPPYLTFWTHFEHGSAIPLGARLSISISLHSNLIPLPTRLLPAAGKLFGSSILALQISCLFLNPPHFLAFTGDLLQGIWFLLQHSILTTFAILSSFPLNPRSQILNYSGESNSSSHCLSLFVQYTNSLGTASLESTPLWQW